MARVWLQVASSLSIKRYFPILRTMRVWSWMSFPYRFVIEPREGNWCFRMENGRFLFALPDRGQVIDQATSFLRDNGGYLLVQTETGIWEEEKYFPITSNAHRRGA